MISATLSDIMTTERKQECPLPFPGKKRKVLDSAFAESDRLGVPVIFVTRIPASAFMNRRRTYTKQTERIYI